MPEPRVAAQLEDAVRLHRAGRLADAELAYRRILHADPEHADALHLLGVIAHQSGHSAQAVDLIARAIRVRPNAAEFYNNIGSALLALGRVGHAIEAFHAALQLKPAYGDALTNLGNALRDQDDLDGAAAAYRAALAVVPRDPDIHINLGNVIADLGEAQAAAACFRRALDLKPDSAAAHSRLIFSGLFDPAVSLEEQGQEMARWRERHERPRRPARIAYPNGRDPERPLRIGYLSSYFHRHVVGQNILPLFERRDRAGFHAFCYADVSRPDSLTKRFRESADEWRGIVGRSDATIAEVVARDQIDILVDLNLHMDGNKLLVFARKPAPLQVSFAGYPGSTGLEGIDYRFTDRRLETPEIVARLQPEQPVFLPHTFWCYNPLEPDLQPAPPPSDARGVVTFASLNNFRKVNPPVLALWARVLAQVPESELLLLCPHGAHRARILGAFADAGVAPSRIRLQERLAQRRYLELHHQADLILDTYPYTGHTTTCDALWMGVPVVTLAGAAPVARAGLSLLTEIGAPELVARDPEGFVHRAVDLARDPARLRALRSRLRPAMETSGLMDPAAFTRAIERGYREMWRQWCAGGPTREIDLG